MAKFTTLIDNQVVAEQIACLLNTYSNLHKKHSAYSIIYSNIEYFIIYGVIENRVAVVGCVGIAPQQQKDATLIKHLCIHEHYRHLGYAKNLLNISLNCCTTSSVFLTVVETNTACLNLLTKFNFIVERKDFVKDHYVLTLGKKLEK